MVTARTFIDCSRDGDLGYFAGVPYEKGNATGAVQYPTLMFRLHQVNDEIALFRGKPNFDKLLKQANESGQWFLPRTSAIFSPQVHSGEWRVNLTQVMKKDSSAPDGTNIFDLTFAELESWRQIANAFCFMKQNVPGFENSYLLEIAPQIGIRESRRLAGLYTLTEEDILLARKFDDSIGVNGWPIENHTKDSIQWKWIGGCGYHQIPFRSLIPVNVKNLFMAGRCASFTSEALASVRVSGPCFVMGEAVGTAAALNLKNNRVVDETDVHELQEKLVQNGVFLGN